MATLISLTGKEQNLKLTGFYGDTTPVHEFEKLNQIGEGSKFPLVFLRLTFSTAFGVVLYPPFNRIGLTFVSVVLEIAVQAKS
jgi:hypothetical protein